MHVRDIGFESDQMHTNCTHF